MVRYNAIRTTQWSRKSRSRNETGSSIGYGLKNKVNKIKNWYQKTWQYIKESFSRIKTKKEQEELYETAWEWNKEELELEIRNGLNEKTPLVCHKSYLYSSYN